MAEKRFRARSVHFMQDGGRQQDRAHRPRRVPIAALGHSGRLCRATDLESRKLRLREDRFETVVKAAARLLVVCAGGVGRSQHLREVFE
jgi:hypothetical protein